MAAKWQASWKEKPHASKQLSAARRSSTSSANTELNRDPMETAGIRDSRGDTSRAPGGKVRWHMPNMRRHRSCCSRAKATRPIPKASPKRCTARCGKKEFRYSYCSSRVKITVLLEETSQAGQVRNRGPV